MTMDDVEIVEFPYADDWFNNPEMLTPFENPSEWQLNRDCSVSELVGENRVKK